MASNGNENEHHGDFEFASPVSSVPNGLSKINTKKPVSREVCKDDTAPTVKVRAECGGASCSTEKEGIGSNDAPKCYKPLHAQDHDSSLLSQRRGASEAADAVHQVNKTLDVCLLSWIAS